MARIICLVHVEAGTTAVRRRRRRSWTRLLLLRGLPVATLLGAIGVMIGLAFAGSPTKIAEGVRVAGIDVGGLTPRQARALLERRAQAVADRPVQFTAGERTWKIKPTELGVTVDWAAAVRAAERQGEGFGPFRGFRRLDVRFFGADVEPAVRVWNTALSLELQRLASDVDRAPKEASIRLAGLRPVIVPARTGAVLDRKEAAQVLVRGLSSFERAPLGLPVHVAVPRVTALALAPAA